MGERIASCSRKTAETNIELRVNLDGTGKNNISTGIGFFDHMLDGMARHGFLDLSVQVTGDLYVDDHHTIEDTGIVLGDALAEAVGSKKGIRRFGSVILPMDDALVLVAADLSGRPYFSYDVPFPTESVGGMKTEMVREFFYAVSCRLRMNLHIKMLDGINSHHIAEAVFKAFGRALDEATKTDPRITDVLSTKGTL